MLTKLNRGDAGVPPAFTERVLQFGGGNFLRAFVDWIIDVYNEESGTELGILVVKTTNQGSYKAWQNQEGLFHVLTRGIANGERINTSRLISSVSRILHLMQDWDIYLKSAENPNIRYIFSNTTEAGIVFSKADGVIENPIEFPAKLTAWLYHRYNYFKADLEKGCIIFPTELIIGNGNVLKQCILDYSNLWKLEVAFVEWIESANTFCNTLVDRIVPGVEKNNMPKEWEKIGVEDQMITEAEVYHFFAVQAPDFVSKELPLHNIGINVQFVNDLESVRVRKVRILNGAHTSMVPTAYLYGMRTVMETIEHPVLGKWLENLINNEVIPSLDGDVSELHAYAESILDRFRNPYVKHQLLSISLNSITKFRTRILPSILDYIKKFEVLPKGLVFAFAALIHFYKGHDENANTIPLNDDPKILEKLKHDWKNCEASEKGMLRLAISVLGWKEIWDRDLSVILGFPEMLGGYLYAIETNGIVKELDSMLLENENN